MRIFSVLFGLLLFNCQLVFGQSICQEDQRQISELIFQFEEFQKKHDPQGILKLFTPPSTNEEKDSYSSLLASNAFPDGSSARLYSNVVTNFRVESFIVKGVTLRESLNQRFCIIHLEEKRTYSPGPAARRESVSQTVNENKALVLVKVDNDWMVDKYSEEGRSLTKYSGWGY